MAFAAAAASLVSTAFGVAGALQQGASQSAAAKYQAQRAEQAAKYARVNADMTDTYYRDELRSTLSNIDAIRASAGTNPDAPTAVALRDKSTETSNRQRTIAVLNYTQQEKQSLNDASFFRSSAKTYQTAGFLNAGAMAFKGVAPILGDMGKGSFG